MMADSSKSQQKSAGKKPPSQEQIVSGFNEMRQQQRTLAGKISELEMEKRDHEMVIEALKEVKPERKCFRMVGGVLIERTVQEVLPPLEGNNEQLGRLVQGLGDQLAAKGKEINTYREKHGLRIRGEEDTKTQHKEGATPSSGVLVQQSA